MSDDRSSFDKLPLRDFGFEDIPAVPLDIEAVPATLVRLGLRAVETKQAVEGLSNTYDIDGRSAPAHAFLFGSTTLDPSAPEGEKGSFLGRLVTDAKEKLEAGVDRVKDAVHDTVDGVLRSEHAAIDVPTPKSDRGADRRRALYHLTRKDPDKFRELLKARLRLEPERTDEAATDTVTAATPKLTQLFLDAPEQFAISWTNMPPVLNDAGDLLEPFSRSLDDAEAATRAFWPTIAHYGLPFNLILPKKVDDVDDVEAERLRDVFGRAWTEEIEARHRDGALYVIDLTIFESLAATAADGAERFTPSTLTLLAQDPASKRLDPMAVRVAGQAGAGAQFFLRHDATPGAWLYALQAAKASITVYGIWLGHVYHWHIVTAAMLMTAGETLPEDHPVERFLTPQSGYVMAFDNVLLGLWKHIAPPTSLTSARQFIALSNSFAKGRQFFDDDPTTTLEHLQITAEDFTVSAPWDAYPMVGHLLGIWETSRDYASAYVHAAYADDAAVAGDVPLQKWITASGDPDGGNVRGLPRMDSREALTRVLTSLIYRTTAHGTSRLGPAANPGLSFVGNFPPTLQNATIPGPGDDISTGDLLRYLPQTGSIGQMVTFLFTFSFSAPYVPLLPIDGVETDLFYGPDPNSAENAALVRFRNGVLASYEAYAGPNPPRLQWPRNIET